MILDADRFTDTEFSNVPKQGIPKIIPDYESAGNLIREAIFNMSEGIALLCLHSDLNTRCCVGAAVIENHRFPLSRSEGLSLSVGYCFSEMGPLGLGVMLPPSRRICR